MARKITFTEVPSSKGWEPFLKGMAVKDPAILFIVFRSVEQPKTIRNIQA